SERHPRLEGSVLCCCWFCEGACRDWCPCFTPLATETEKNETSLLPGEGLGYPHHDPEHRHHRHPTAQHVAGPGVGGLAVAQQQHQREERGDDGQLADLHAQVEAHQRRHQL